MRLLSFHTMAPAPTRAAPWCTPATAVLLAICLGGAGAASSALAPGIEQKEIVRGGERHSYYLFVPPRAPRTSPLPLLVVMHGAGGNGLDQISAWRAVADQYQFMLLGPNIANSPAAWDDLYDHPEWIRDAIGETSAEHPVDGRRMYLWGYSAGGMFSFYFAFLESRYFAAAAVHGGVIENFKYQMADFAARKLPIAYYIGTRDQWWPVEKTRASRDALLARGFPLHYVELAGADHNFFASAGPITSDAWKFMSRHALDADPRFDPLDLKRIKSALRWGGQPLRATAEIDGYFLQVYSQCRGRNRGKGSGLPASSSAP